MQVWLDESTLAAMRNAVLALVGLFLALALFTILWAATSPQM